MKVAIVVSLVWVPALFGKDATKPSVLIFHHVNVIPMAAQNVLRDQDVVVIGERIARIGPAKVSAPKGATVIDAGGQYLIPGLIDSHVHLYGRQHFSLFLANGVTTVFNLDGRPLHLVWRDDIAAGRMLGPRVFTVAPKFDRVDPPEKAVALVDQYSKTGYDGIKIYNQVSKAEYPALIAAARQHNMLVVGHIARDPGFEMTLQAGQAIAHAEEFLYTFFKDHPRDPALIPDAVAKTKGAGVPVIATLVTYRNIVDQVTDFNAYLERSEMKYWPPWEMEDIKDPNNNPYLAFDADDFRSVTLNYPFLETLVKALHDAGVPILVGSDGGGIANVPGFTVHDEMEILVRCGFTPFDALRAATSAPAQFLRHEREFGTIEQGKVADLVLLSSNPLLDIRNTRKIRGVVVKGRWLSQEALETLLSDLPDSYARDERQAQEKLLRNPSEAVAFLNSVDPFFDDLAAAAVKTLAARIGTDSLQKLIRDARAADPATAIATPEFLNGIAGYLAGKDKKDDALALYQFNVDEHPDIAIAWDRLARAHYRLGHFDLALKFYKKAVEVDPGYWNVDFANRRIRELTAK